MLSVIDNYLEWIFTHKPNHSTHELNWATTDSGENIKIWQSKGFETVTRRLFVSAVLGYLTEREFRDDTMISTWQAAERRKYTFLTPAAGSAISVSIPRGEAIMRHAGTSCSVDNRCTLLWVLGNAGIPQSFGWPHCTATCGVEHKDMVSFSARCRRWHSFLAETSRCVCGTSKFIRDSSRRPTSVKHCSGLN